MGRFSRPECAARTPSDSVGTVATSGESNDEEARPLRAAEFLNVHPVFFQERPSRTLKSHLEDCREEILQAMDQWGIDQVWTPAYEGGHRDHDAVNALCVHYP